jgi:protein pelota
MINKKIKIAICIETIEFDAEQCSLRVKGRNKTESDYIKLDQFHTIELELKKKFTIIKEHWDFVSLERLNEASDPTKRADIAVLVMQEGLANLCLVKSTLTKTCANIVRNIPKNKNVFLCFYIDVYSKYVLMFFLFIFIISYYVDISSNNFNIVNY